MDEREQAEVLRQLFDGCYLFGVKVELAFPDGFPDWLGDEDQARSKMRDMVYQAAMYRPLLSDCPQVTQPSFKNECW